MYIQGKNENVFLRVIRFFFFFVEEKTMVKKKKKKKKPLQKKLSGEIKVICFWNFFFKCSKIGNNRRKFIKIKEFL